MMKIVQLLAATTAALTVATAAHGAATVVASTPYAFNVYPVGYDNDVITFDAGGAPYTLTGPADVRSGSQSNIAAAPATSATTDDTTNYLAAFPTTSELSGFGLRNGVSLYWGSIDGYNSLSLYNGATLVGTITGAMASVNPNGDQDSAITNRRVTIAADGAFDRIRFDTGQNAFEVDNIGFSAAVPEPATWAMMIMGFGLTGAAMRRRGTARLASC